MKVLDLLNRNSSYGYLLTFEEANYGWPIQENIVSLRLPNCPS